MEVSLEIPVGKRSLHCRLYAKKVWIPLE